ncbi:hypothetical protein [Brevibacillus laterosporus]|uniref:hypothetical protein n=1 Tax=Brevibacillus laterosporus TaxID=1465 RepID=UPI0018F889EA|nr:hypothetical protein [Brevibacillus laterosporus]MBG9776164.1 hypothetical protein [Brevibacillus laterosporus]
MRKLLKHPLISATLATIIGTAIVTPIVAYINTIKWTEALTLMWNTVINWAYLVLNFQIKLWWILIAILVFALTIYLIYKFTPSSPEAGFLSYKTDVIEGIIWQWRWSLNYQGNYSISNLRPICNNCKSDLVKYEGFYSENEIKCVICGYNKQVNILDDYIHKIEIEIGRRVRTNEYKQKIEASKIS